MRVSTVLPYQDWRDCGPAARAAEADGASVIQCPELANDPFIPLAFAAMGSERIELATSVAIAFPRSPMVVANLAWDLARHSRGRFVLGLGSQVRAHNERRFSVPWVAPAARMGEYVQALRAIWRCWETGAKLDYSGEHYSFTLMTPEFSPPQLGLPMPPVMIAAVGPHMLKEAARHCDGVRLHGFNTRRYLEEVVTPGLEKELAGRGKDFDSFEVTGGGFVVTGPDEEAVKAAAEKIRYRVGFYGSTPQYRGVLELHGLTELGARLNAATRRGAWGELAGMIDDEVLDLFIARATYDKLPEAVARRFGGVADTVTVDFLPDTDARTRRKVIDGIRQIPSRFEAYRTSWEV
jgi:probable F420-dependent oxidoreductase